MKAQPSLIQDKQVWNAIVQSLPHAHLLQSWEWGEFKCRHGWQAQRLTWLNEDGQPAAAAQILSRRFAVPLLNASPRLFYCPKGPLLDWSHEELCEAVLSQLEGLCQQGGVVQLKIDPDLPLGFGYPDEDGAIDYPNGILAAQSLQARGWGASAEAIQFRNTMTLDLDLTEDALLQGMKQKARYNIGLASRRGVLARRGGMQDIELLYRMYAETSVRDGFVIRPLRYYRDAWGTFIEAGMAQPFVAEVEGEAVAALLIYRFGPRAWFLYGMSRDLHREKMPNYLLQWEAIRWAREQGCTVYDLWGAPDDPAPGDALWGVYRFKSGFGAQVVRTLGPWDFTRHPALYWLYTTAMPRLLSLMRARGKSRVRLLLE